MVKRQHLGFSPGATLVDLNTLPEINIFAPENRWLVGILVLSSITSFLFGARPIFRVYVPVSFREGNLT